MNIYNQHSDHYQRTILQNFKTQKHHFLNEAKLNRSINQNKPYHTLLQLARSAFKNSHNPKTITHTQIEKTRSAQHTTHKTNTNQRTHKNFFKPKTFATRSPIRPRAIPNTHTFSKTHTDNRLFSHSKLKKQNANDTLPIGGFD